MSLTAWRGYRECCRAREADAPSPPDHPRYIRRRLSYYWMLTLLAEPEQPSPWDLRLWRVPKKRKDTAHD